jgi:soluble lytic murein transglycosylase-like protein
MRSALIIACVSLLLFAFMFENLEKKIVFDVSFLNHPEVLKVEQMIDNTGINIPQPIKKRVALAIAENARYYKIKPEQLVAIAYVESRFNPNAFNKDRGDIGLMQINWPTWKNKFTRNPNELFNVYKNVEVACKIININRRISNNIASYHSFTPEFRSIYMSKLNSVLRRI